MKQSDKKLEQATEGLHATIEKHLSQFSPEEQKRRWDALEDYLNDVASGSSAKRRER